MEKFTSSFAVKPFFNLIKNNDYIFHSFKCLVFQYGGGKVSAPGVIGGWKENLQGKFRLLSPQEKRDIFVTTSYGQVNIVLII